MGTFGNILDPPIIFFNENSGDDAMEEMFVFTLDLLQKSCRRHTGASRYL